jgi:hypothetical protein
MKKPEIQIKVALGLGKGRDRVLTCDLTKEYIAINGDYRSSASSSRRAAGTDADPRTARKSSASRSRRPVSRR